MFIEMIQNYIGWHFLLKDNDDAHTVSVGLIIYIGYALQFFLIDQVGDFFDHLRLVDHIGYLCYDNALPSCTGDLDFSSCPDNYPSSSGLEGFPDSLLSVNNTACREVRTLDVLHQTFGRDLGIINESYYGIN